MALINCEDCGQQVSTMATSCPHCGYPLQEQGIPAATPPPVAPPPPPTRRGTSPWTVIGWIVLAVLLLFLYSCMKFAANYAETSAPAAPGSALSQVSDAARGPNYQVKVNDSGCEERGQYTVIRATITNVGDETIPFAKAFFEGYDKAGKVVQADDGYFSPSDVQPGARASANVYLRASVDNCALVRIQGSRGGYVSIQ